MSYSFKRMPLTARQLDVLKRLDGLLLWNPEKGSGIADIGQPDYVTPLRLYQIDAVADTWNYLETQKGNPCIVIPTGGGKTQVIVALCADAVFNQNQKVMILAHVKELLAQSLDKIVQFCPSEGKTLARWTWTGVYCAGLEGHSTAVPAVFRSSCRDTNRSLVVGSIQSVCNRAKDFGHRDLLIVDEAHRIPTKGEGQYRRFIDEMRKMNPNLRVVGLTATPFRTESGLICLPGKKYILNRISYEAQIIPLIERGFLCNVRTKGGSIDIDTRLSGVRIQAGDYVISQLEPVMCESTLVSTSCREIVQWTAHRKKVLIFATDVNHGLLIRRTLANCSGVDCGFICGDDRGDNREKTIRQFKNGQLKYLVNVNILTVGFDAPDIDCVAILRPTQSPGLFYQMVGRGFRVHPQKKDCLILDFGGNTLRHGPVDQLSKTVVGREWNFHHYQAKQCPHCNVIVGLDVPFCPECGYEFPYYEKPIRHDSYASELPVLSQEPSQEEIAARVAKDAMTLFAQGEYEEALAKINEAISLTPSEKRYHYQQDKQKIERAYDEAKKRLEKTQQAELERQRAEAERFAGEQRLREEEEQRQREQQQLREAEERRRRELEAQRRKADAERFAREQRLREEEEQRQREQQQLREAEERQRWELEAQRRKADAERFAEEAEKLYEAAAYASSLVKIRLAINLDQNSSYTDLQKKIQDALNLETDKKRELKKNAASLVEEAKRFVSSGAYDEAIAKIDAALDLEGERENLGEPFQWGINATSKTMELLRRKSYQSLREKILKKRNQETERARQREVDAKRLAKEAERLFFEGAYGKALEKVHASLALIPQDEVTELQKKIQSQYDLFQQNQMAKAKRQRERQAQIEQFYRIMKIPGGRWQFEIGGISYVFHWCPEGTFKMGSPSGFMGLGGESGRDVEEKPHWVTLTRGFWIGEPPVTQWQWRMMMGSPPSTSVWGRHPVVSIHWGEAQLFLRQMNSLNQEILNSRPDFSWHFAIPTEAQWEYACRAGTTGPYNVVGDPESSGWFDQNSEGKIHEVGLKQANAWGLYDMHGNVWEWCHDWYGPYPSTDVTDPIGPGSGTSRVIRGGSWFDDVKFARSASRFSQTPSTRNCNLGLRLVICQLEHEVIPSARRRLFHRF